MMSSRVVWALAAPKSRPAVAAAAAILLIRLRFMYSYLHVGYFCVSDSGPPQCGPFSCVLLRIRSACRVSRVRSVAEDRVQEFPRAGVFGFRKDVLRRAFFRDFAGVEKHDAVGHVLREAQIGRASGREGEAVAAVA